MIEVKVAPLCPCYRRAIGAAVNGARGQMAYYRLYFMDPRSGHISAFEAIEADDDQAAITISEKHLGWQPLELWCEGRKVQRFEAVTDASSHAESR